MEPIASSFQREKSVFLYERKQKGQMAQEWPFNICQLVNGLSEGGGVMA